MILDDYSRTITGAVDRSQFVLDDDSSTYGTTKIARDCHDGLKRAAGLAKPDDAIVMMDADNKQPASLIPRILQAVETGYDLVIASRFRPGAQVLGLSAFRSGLTIASSLLKRAFTTYNGSFVTETGFACMAEILTNLRALAPASKMPAAWTVGRSLNLLWRG